MARVLLSKEIQYQLCLTARDKLGSSWRGLARYLNVHPHTFDNWYRCDNLLPEKIFSKLVSISNFSIKQKVLLPDDWGRVKGGRNSVAKHGRSFWTLEGSRKGGTNSAKRFTLPIFSKDLAEFIGIMLGDGGMSSGQVSITLGYSTDWEYGRFIIKLIEKLFGVTPSIYKELYKDAFKVRVSGVNFVRNMQIVGLRVGNKIKQKFDVPFWIKDKEEYIKACIRGMIDTDGCVHRKVRKEHNGIEYRSIGITFCSLSKPLQLSFIKLLNTIGFRVSISGKTIYLCGKEQIERYVQEIGFSNPKHLQRYYRFQRDYGWIKVQTKIV
mgnify:FL=1